MYSPTYNRNEDHADVVAFMRTLTDGYGGFDY